MRLDVDGATVAHPLSLGDRELHLQHIDDALGNVILHRKDILEFPVIALGPHMGTGGGVNELYRDAHPLCRAVHTAFKQVSDSQFGTDLLGALRHIFVDKGGVTGGEKKNSAARKMRNQNNTHGASAQT